MSTKLSKPPLIVFTLTSARSGTLYLRDLCQKNAVDCACRHEPFFDWGNPTLFGPAIYDAYAGRVDRIRERLARKRDYISRLGKSVYVESSHAFLKSIHVAALEFFPDLRLIHLVRHPLLVAKSEAVREARRRYAPFHYYRGDDGRRHFCWSLTTNEEIYNGFDRSRMTLFQKYLIQWIEIENRAIAYLEHHQLHDRCFTMHSPRDLNNPATIGRLFDFLGLQRKHSEILTGGRRNASHGYSNVLQPADEQEAEEVLSAMPDRYLEIFRRKPYTHFDWSSRLQGCPHGKPRWRMRFSGFCFLFLLLASVSCRTAVSFAPVNLGQTGWSVHRGQAIWRRQAGSAGIAGDLLVATRSDGEAFVQFSKGALPLVTAQSRPHAWRAAFPLDKGRQYSGRGRPPLRIIFLQLVPVLAGAPTPRDYSWHSIPGDGWSLENTVTGESLEVYWD